MNADQLIAELADVPRSGADEWRDLRSDQIAKLSPDDAARVYAEWRKLKR